MAHTPYTALNRLVHLHNLLNTSHWKVMKTRCCLYVTYLVKHGFPKLVQLGRTHGLLSSQINLGNELVVFKLHLLICILLLYRR